MSAGTQSFQVEESIDFSLIPENAPLFGSAAWLEVLKAGLGHKLKVLLLLEKEKTVAWLPLYTVKKGPFAKAYLPPMTPYGGPYIAKDNGEVRSRPKFIVERMLAGKLLDYLAQQYSYCLFRPENSDIRQALWKGWTPGVSYVLETDLETYSQGGLLGKRTQETVKIASNHGLTFQASREDARFEEGFNRIFQRKHLNIPFNASEVVAMRRKAAELGITEDFVVKDREGNPLVYYSTIPDQEKGRVTCWMISTLPEAEKNQASVFMYWNLLEYYSGKAKVLELGGGDDRGVAEFKEKFATGIRPYMEMDHYRSRTDQFFIEAWFKLRNR